jgi:hypothetical protein
VLPQNVARLLPDEQKQAVEGFGEKRIYVTFELLELQTELRARRLSFLLGILTREDGTDTLSRNVGK